MPDRTPVERPSALSARPVDQYVREFFSDLAGAFTGGVVGVALLLAGVYLASGLQSALLEAGAVLAFFFAAYRCWKKQFDARNRDWDKLLEVQAALATAESQLAQREANVLLAHVAMQWGKVREDDALLVKVWISNSGPSTALTGWRSKLVIDGRTHIGRLFDERAATTVIDGTLTDLSEHDFLLTQIPKPHGVPTGGICEGWIAFSVYTLDDLKEQIKQADVIEINCCDAWGKPYRFGRNVDFSEPMKPYRIPY